VLIALVYSLPGLFLIRPVADGLGVFFLIILMPFIVLVVVGLSQNSVDFSTLLDVRSDVSWTQGFMDLINVLYWNFSGIDSASTSAGEVVNPSVNYVRGLMACVLLTTLTYFVPLFAAAAVNKPDFTEWHDTSFATIAKEQAGPWLMNWIAVAGIIGNAGMHIAEMFEDSWQLHGMAEVGLVPSVFKYRHPRFKTPWACLTLQVAIICCLEAFNFKVILCIDNFFSVMSVLLEVCAFLYFRFKRPELQTPYRVPLSNLAVTAMSVPIFVMGLMVAIAGLVYTRESLIINSAFLVFGVLFSIYMLRCGHSTYIPRSPQTREAVNEESSSMLGVVNNEAPFQSSSSLGVEGGGARLNDNRREAAAALLQPEEKKANGAFLFSDGDLDDENAGQGRPSAESSSRYPHLQQT